MFFLYEVLLHLVFILAVPWLLAIGFLRGKYLPNMRQRLGLYRGAPARHDLWIHAVSVGETLAARTVIQQILARRPQTSIVVTTTTITGQNLARQFFPDVSITYFPFDFSFSVKRFLDHHQPRIYATMETEIWPNAARIAHSRGIRLVLANGRISDRSYPRYRLIRFFLSRVLSFFDCILVREEVDGERFVRIGARREQIQVAGNIKFDVVLPDRDSELERDLAVLAAGRPIFVAGSTVEGEDELIVPELAGLIRETGCFVVLAPRKPGRFEIVAGLLTAASLRFGRRSESNLVSSEYDVLLLDTIGELAGVYRFAAAAFVGGSLVDSGGHNPIEPAAVGVPVAFGPSMRNFREIATSFEEEGAAVVTPDVESLMRFVRSMMADPEKRSVMAASGMATVARNRGAAGRIADRLMVLLA